MLSSVMLTPATALAAQDSNEPVTTETRSIKDESTSAANTSASDSSTGQSSQLGENNTENSLPVTENSSSKQQTTNEQSSSASTTSDSRSDEQATSTTETNNKAESSSSKASSESKEATADKPKETRKSVNGLLPNFFTDAWYTDKDGNRLDGTDQIKVGDDITLNYTWAIPDDVKDQINAGDTYSFELPKGMKIPKELSGDLKDAEGNVYGHFVIGTDGKATITFTDEIHEKSRIHGSLYAAGQVKLNDDGTDPGLDIPINDETHTDVPGIEVNEGSSLAKEVAGKTLDKDIKDNKANIRWKLKINHTTSALEDGATISDPMPKGFTYKGNEKLYAWDVAADGSLINKHEVNFSDIFTVTDPSVTFKLKDGLSDAQKHAYYELEFDTEADLSQVDDLNDKDNIVKVKNEATLHQPSSDDVDADASTDFHNNLGLEKKGEIQANGVIKWTVHVKTSGMGLDAGTELWDQMDNKQKITDQDGNPIDLSNAVQTVGNGPKINVKDNGKGSYTFTTATDAASNTEFDLVYYTKADGDNVQSNNTIGWDGGHNDGHVGGPSTMTKDPVGSVDKNNHTMNYVIKVNTNHQKITSAKVVDGLSEDASRAGLSMTQQQIDNIKVVRVVNGKEKTLTKGQDYEVTTEPNQAPYSSYTVVLDKAIGSGTTDEFRVYSTASYDPSLGDHTYRNWGHYYYTTENGKGDGSDSVDINPGAKTKTDISKGGDINPIDGTVDWTIKFNDNHKQLGANGQLVDTLPSSGIYYLDIPAGDVPSDLYTVAKDGQPVTNVKATYDGNHQITFTGFEAGDNSAYEVHLITKIKRNDDGSLPVLSKDIKNKAKYTDDNVYTSDVKAGVSYQETGDLIQKGHEGPDENRNVHYTVKVNPDTETNSGDHKLKLNNVTVEDHPEDTSVLRVDPSSFKVTYKDGTPVPAADYELNAGEQGFTLKFLVTVDQEIHIEYDAKVLIPAGSLPNQDINAVNRATITGVVPGKPGTNDNVHIEVPKAGGDAEGILGSLTITKKDAHDASLLDGAEFDLYRTTKDGERGNKVGTVTTANGIAKFDNLTMGSYILVETKAPAGYDISPEFKLENGGKIVTVKDNGEDHPAAYVTVKDDKLTQVSGTKTWQDNDDQDDLRPESITVHLWNKNTGKEVATKVVTATDNWQYSFDNLPMYDQDGIKIVYYVTEDDVANYTGKQDGMNLTNTHTPATTAVSGKKTWDDHDNQDGTRPDSITVHLLANGQEVASKTVTANDNWAYSFSNLPMYDHGEKIIYTVSETLPDGTEYIGDTTNGSSMNLTNKYAPKKRSISVHKVWEDANNQDGLRPNSIWVQLWANGEKYGSPVTLNEANAWAYTWTDLDQKANGQDINYEIKEVKVPGYDTEIVAIKDGNITITNKRTPSTTEIHGTKTWNDGDNQDHTRPDSIKVNLLANGTVVDTKTVTAKDGWKYDFTDLPEYKDGEKIVYTVTEDVVGGYSTQLDGTDIINSYTPAKTSVTVNKAWQDNNNQDGLRSNIRVQLYDDLGKKVGNVVTLNANNNWQYTWTNLPLNRDGQPIIYSVKELDIPEGYDSVIGQIKDGNITITNVHTPETINLKGTKTWDDKDNQDGERPDEITVYVTDDLGKTVATQTVKPDQDGNWNYSFKDLPKYRDGGQLITYTVHEAEVPGYTTDVDKNNNLTNTHTPGKTSLRVTKAWNDNNNQDGIRPASIQVQLYADGKELGEPVTLNAANQWTYNWTDLDLRKAGQDIKYTVEEVGDNKGYTLTTDVKDASNVILTNNHTPEVTKISGVKTWKDNDDQDGKRPSSINVNLLANGVKVASKTVTAKDDWKYEFTNLPKYENGKEIKYTVTEDKVDDYTTTINGTDITNAYTPEVTTAHVAKVWDDANNQDGKRPSSIKVQLYADGIASGDAITLNADNNWQHTWTGLDAMRDHGTKIVYTVKEVGSNTGYTLTVDDKDKDNMTLTNTHTPEVTKISGTKTWQDNDDQDGDRPTSIKVNLFANGKQVASKTVTAADDWKYEFTDLPKYENGEIIKYTITEDTVADYTTEINDFDLTNEHTPGKTSATVTKAWNDNNNQDGIRPDEIKVQLYADNVAKGDVVTLTAKDNWTYTWHDLDAKRDHGKDIVYTVKEVGSNKGYDITTDTTDHGNMVITNTHTPEVTKVNGVKTWKDNDDQDGKRPSSINVNLYGNGNLVASKKVTAEDDWKYEFKDLPKYENGKLVKYTVSEDTVADYTTTYDNDGMDITNTHTPEETTAQVTKAWDDMDNQDGLRPNEIQVQLYADGVAKGDVVTLTAANDWHYTWTKLPVYKDHGKTIVYTVQEVGSTDGYDVAINDSDKDNMIITNTHVPATTSIKGTKTWKDNDDQDGKRPSEITVNLLSDGTPIASKTVTADNDWKYEFTNLPKYRQGKEIHYSITENAVDGYTTEDNNGGVDLTNDYTPEKTSATVTKAWNDNNDQDGLRPDEIKVQLYADGVAQGDVVTLTAKDNWTYTWHDLDAKKDHGKEIVYTVKEVGTTKGYDVTTDTTDHGNMIITNSHTPATTEVSGVKTWKDNNDQDGKRPSEITVNLLANGKQVASKTVTAKDDWQYSFTDLPEYEAGQKVVYTVTENAVKDYTTTIDGTDLTNEHTPGKTSATVTKTWNDSNDHDGLRPGSIRVQLYANGVATGDVVKLNADNKWNYTWSDLDAMKSGKEVVYTVKEVSSAYGYTTTVNDQDHGN